MTVDLEYTVDGPAAGPTVVLGPSLGTTGAIWRDQLPALSSRFRVVRYQHRGHAGSAAPPGPYRFDDLGGDLLALLDTVGVERVHLAGVSLGGALAAWVAATAASRVDRLVLVATSPRFGEPLAWADRAATVRAQGTGAVAETVVARWFTPDFANREPQVVAWTRSQLAETDAGAYAAYCDILQRLDLTPLLPAITAPTLVIAGADDPVSPPAQANAIVAAVPRAELAVVPGTAHLTTVEQPAAVTKLLLDFLGADNG
jgi:3-oxoadipate enol-lactonase